jgi:patatin-like phospholipase/acyl hydrolase
MAAPFRVLSIDGGGIRGLIPALVLAELERLAERPVFELFDLIAGTSTGGLLALTLTRPGGDGRPAPAREIVGLYEEEGPRIFHRSLVKRVTSVEGLLDEKYDAAGLDAALAQHLGDTMLSEALVPVTVTAYETRLRADWFFRRDRARSDPAYDFRMRDAARATAAAPTYFEPALVVNAATQERWSLIDGGVYAANPGLVAWVDAHGLEGDDRPVRLVSLGTGSQIEPIPYEDAKGWGALEWARPIIDVVLDGQSQAVERQLESLTPLVEHHRLQVELREASTDLDDASAENLERLRGEAERLIADEQPRLAELGRVLAA